MPPLTPAQAVAQLVADQPKYHAVLHGPAAGDASQVELESGAQKTVARMMAEAQALLDAGGTDKLSAVKWTSASADVADKEANAGTLNALLVQAAAQGVGVLLPAYFGKIPCDSQINVPDGTWIDCAAPGTTFLDFSDAEGEFPDGAYVVAKGTFTELPSLNANAQRGQISATLASIPDIDLVQGDILFFVDKGNLWNGARPTYWEGEALYVHSQAGAVANFQSAYISNYAAATTKVNRLNGVRVGLRNFGIIGGAANQATEMAAWAIIGGRRCIVENVIGTNANYAGGTLIFCVDCVVNNNEEAKLLPDAGQGESYATSVANSQNIVVNGGRYISSRHGISLGGLSSDYAIITRYIVVSNAYCGRNAQSDTTIYAADMHGDCEYCYYVDCIIDGGLDLGGSNNFVWGGITRAGKSLGGAYSAFEISEAKSLNLILKPAILIISGYNPDNEDYGIALNAGWSGNGITEHTTEDGTLVFEPGLVIYDTLEAPAGHHQSLISIQNNGSTARLRIIIGGDWQCRGIGAADYVTCDIKKDTGADFDYVDLSRCTGDMAWRIQDTKLLNLDHAKLNQVGLNKAEYEPEFGTGAGITTNNVDAVSAIGLRLKGDAGTGLLVQNAVTADVTGISVSTFSTGLSFDSVERLKLAPGDLDGDGIALQSCPSVYYTPGVKDGPVNESGSGTGVTIYKNVFKSPPLALDLNGTDNTGVAAGSTGKITGWHVASAKAVGWDDANQKYVFTDGRARRVKVIWKARVAGAGMTYTSQPQVWKNGANLFAGEFINGLTGATEVAGICIADVDMNGTSDYLEFYLGMPTGATALKGTIASTFIHIVEIY